jgi:uncharacterized damage-inducible protein DinB
LRRRAQRELYLASAAAVGAGDSPYITAMLATLRDLFGHQAFTDAALLNAIRRHDTAAGDAELRTLLHHILLAHRYWIHLGQGLPFFMEEETTVPDSFDTIVARYQATQAQERVWLDGLRESDLARALESPFFPGRLIAMGDALMQICMHSHGHRSQCAMKLRALGGEPPSLDFILWLKDRPVPDWE